MRLALEEARAAAACDEVPVGAVICQDGRVIARAHNTCEASRDATAHAEMLALRQAQHILGRWRLTDCTLFVTLEPCAMCAGAILATRIGRVLFGAYDARAGCSGSLYALLDDDRLGHTLVAGGVEEEACAALLQTYFQKKRKERAKESPC